MRLHRLDLENFGIHTEQSFPFAEQGLQLIYGRNEAGKSTLLQAVREFLFGFAHAGSNPFAPDAKNKKMQATAQLQLKDGSQLEVVRRQGNKNTLSGSFAESDDTIDEPRWLQLLGGADQQMYQHVFGFSLKELATGEESLKEANLDEALFGGGLGRLHDYKQLIKSIDEEAENLFKSRGQKQQINSILSEIKTLKAELKESSLRPAEYEEWLTQARRCEQDLTRLQSQYEKFYRRQQHLDRLKRAHPLWIELQTRQDQLSRLESPQSFPADALDELSQTRTQAKKLASEVDTHQRELERIDQEIKDIHFSNELIEAAEAIRSLVYGIKEVRGYRRDLPLRQQEQLRDLTEAAAILRRIDPKLKLDQVNCFELTLAQRNKITQLSRQQQKTQTELQSQAPDLERLEMEIRELETSLAEAPTQPAELIERLQTSREPLREAIKRKAEVESAIADLQSKRSLRTASVQAMVAEPLDLATPLPLPLESTIAHYESQFQSLAEELRGAKRAVREATDELTAKRDELRRLEQGVELVTKEQLSQMRTQRDASWQQLREMLLGEAKAADASTSQADAFEGEIRTSDDMADQRYRNAQLLAEHQAMQGQITSLEERLHARQQVAEQLEQQQDALTKAWLAEWQASGIRPKSPKEMNAWRTAYLELTEIDADVRRKEVELQPLQDRIAASTQLLGSTCQLPDYIEPSEMIDWIDSFLREAESQREKATELKIRLQTKRDQRQSTQQQHDKRRQQLADLESQAAELLSVFDSIGEVNLETAHDLLSAIDEIQGRLASADRLQQRITDMQQGLDEFTEQVQAVISATEQDLGNMQPEHAAERLGSLLTEAKSRYDLRKELEIKRQVTTQTLESRQAEHSELEQRLAGWRKQVDVGSDDELESLSQVVRDRQALAREIAAKESELALVRQSEDAEAFLKDLAELDLDRLELDLTEATRELADIQENLGQINQQLGEWNARLREIDLSSRAVIAQGKIESLQADLSDCLDRLGPLLIAREMLDRAMRAFREENAGQLLASISELLERMTEGRYTRVEHDLEQEGGLLLVGPNNVRKKPSELSTGTREQLYLAIRLAYIRHYCQGAEPLPVLMDDILVNFDDDRQMATLKVLAEFDAEIQIIMLTCHEPLVDKVQSLAGANRVSRIDGEPVTPTVPKPKSSRKKSSSKSSTPSLFENA